MFRPNDQIGPYILVRKLGRGAFGEVWLAEERTFVTTHKVALKLPNEDDIDLNEIRREAALWEEIKGHPNILPIIKADVVDGQVYIASEFASDGSLQQWLSTHGGRAPSVEAAVSMIQGILSGLAHLHGKRVIHRDLKPANILLQSNTPRIADFGISRVLKTTVASANTAGTPAYMAPECFEGKRTERSDLWSAGVIFYQLLTGNLPFPQSDAMSLMNAIITREPQLSMDGLPPDLAAIVRRALEKDPARRFQNAEEMNAALRSADLTRPPSTGEAKTEVLPGSGPSTDPSPIAPTQPFPPSPDPAKPAAGGPARIFDPAVPVATSPPRLPLILGLAGVGLLGLILLVGIVVWRSWPSGTTTGSADSGLTKLLPPGVVIELPTGMANAQTDASIGKAPAVLITFPRTGEIYVGQSRVKADQLGVEITRSLAGSSQGFQDARRSTPVYFLAGGTTTNRQFADIQDTARRQGISNFRLVVFRGTNEQELGTLSLELSAPTVPFQRQPELDLLKVVIRVSAARGILLNTEWMGTVDDTTTLYERLHDIFRQRKDNLIYREGTNEVETTVHIVADGDVTYGDLAKVVNAIAGAGSDRVISDGVADNTAATPSSSPSADPSLTPNMSGTTSPTGSSPDPADANRVYQPNEVDQKARILSKPQPSYTDGARANRIEGSVRVQLVLNANGTVGKAKALSQLPYGLTENALTAARKITFSPAIKGGNPVSCYVTIEYNFAIY